MREALEYVPFYTIPHVFAAGRWWSEIAEFTVLDLRWYNCVC